MRSYALALVVTLTFQPVVQTAAERANAAFDAGEWEAAVELLQGLAHAGELDGEGHFRLGYSHWRLGNCEAVLSAYAGARDTHAEHPRLLGTAAICGARLGRADQALTDLKASLAVGAPALTLLGDPSFTKYADDPRYLELAEAYDNQLRPCMHDEMARQFDFWAGEWDVYSSGVIVGHNRVAIVEGGCLLREEWTSTAGGTGTSINFVDRAAGTWRQIWTNNTGGVTHYEGNLVDGEMRFEGTNVGIGGGTGPIRMTFTPNEDGSVRQFIESSSDGGETWTVSFDGRYVRRPES